MLRVGALEIDGLRYTARWRGEPVALTVTEFLLSRRSPATPATSRRGSS